MPRPRKTLRPISKNIHLPEDIVLQTELFLYSEIEGKVPYGAWQGLIEKLLREHFERVAQRAKFAYLAQEIVSLEGDWESSHMCTDKLMEEQLIALGFDEGVQAIRSSRREYA